MSPVWFTTPPTIAPITKIFQGTLNLFLDRQDFFLCGFRINKNGIPNQDDRA